MNRLVKSIFFLLAMILPFTSSAYNFMVDGLCYNRNMDGTTVTLTFEEENWPRYSSLNGNVVIPETVTHNGVTYDVIAIDNYAFSGCTGIISVTIGNKVTTIAKVHFKAAKE